MLKTKDCCAVWVTVPDVRVGRRLARCALELRLVACANLVSGVESHYWWQGRIERGRELGVIFKTRRALLTRLERCVAANHPYDTPEFVVVPFVAGSRKYLAWLLAETCGSAGKRRGRSG